MFSEVIAIAEITPIVKARIRVVFILFSFSECSPHFLRVHRRWTVGPGRNAESDHTVAAAPHNGERYYSFSILSQGRNLPDAETFSPAFSRCAGHNPVIVDLR